jgi:hypothetical protein
LLDDLAHDLGFALAGPIGLFEKLVGVPDPYQIEILSGDWRRLAVNVTRQGGKSCCAAILALSELLFSPISSTVLLSPSLRQSGDLLRRVTRYYHELPGLAPLVAESASRLESLSGATVISLPATEGTIRGVPSVSLLVLDECARIPREIIRAARPFQAVVAGARCIAMSTPDGMDNFFADRWHGIGWKRIKITADQCPRISREFLAEQLSELGPMAFRQEFYGDFMVYSSGTMFSPQLIQAALDDATVTPLFAPTLRYNA